MKVQCLVKYFFFKQPTQGKGSFVNLSQFCHNFEMFLGRGVDEDARDETHVQTDVETAEDDDGVEEELQLALLLSTGHLDRRQSWLVEQRINEIRYNLRPRRRAARTPVREEKENVYEMDEKEPEFPAGEPELPVEAAASHATVGAEGGAAIQDQT